MQELGEMASYGGPLPLPSYLLQGKRGRDKDRVGGKEKTS